MKLSEICMRDVIVVSPQTDLVAAANLMRQYHVGSLVVLEESGGIRRPVGILTDRDLVVEVLALEVPILSVKVGDIMSVDIVCLNEEEDLSQAIQTMRHKGIRRLPVVDAQGGLVGIVTLEDLLELAVEWLSGLAAISSAEINKERQSRQAY